MLGLVGSVLFAPARAICWVWGDCHAFRLAAGLASAVFVPLVRVVHRLRR